MTLIEKLAPYLPYDTPIERLYESTFGGGFHHRILNVGVLDNYELEDIKPILSPLSDFLESDLPYLVNDHSTDYFSDTNNYNEVMRYIDDNIFHHYTEFLPYGLINWLIQNHYDVFGMIELGEAIDINTLDK